MTCDGFDSASRRKASWLSPANLAGSLLGLVVLFGASCGPQPEIPFIFNEPIEGAEALRAMWFSGTTTEMKPAPPEFDMAGDILGIELTQVDRFSWGVVLIEHVEVRSGFLGRAFGTPSDRICTPVIRTLEDAHVIAHEIGHVLGLGHHADPSNLMYAKKGGSRLETDQEVILRNGTLWYQQCFDDYSKQD